MRYLVEHNTPNGFSVTEVIDEKDYELFCREYNLNPLIAGVETKCNEYVCEHCGIYYAVNPKCNKCEAEYA